MTKSNLRKHLIVAIILVATGTFVRAQVGSDNPTGITGQFNGNVTTGCSYDPYTGNATRSITDIAVAGAVGAYPLAFTRTMNSRDGTGHVPGQGAYEFGKAGGWRHSYQWGINKAVLQTSDVTARPTSYVVFYPEGRRVTFTNPSGGPTPVRADVAGIAERFQPMDRNDPDSNCYLLLPDGGKVWFRAEITPSEPPDPLAAPGDPRPTPPPQPTLTFDYVLIGIIDPYGQLTAISGGLTPTGDFRVSQIAEPAGRVLDLIYTGSGDNVLLQSVTERAYAGAPAGRTVTYNYAPALGVTALDHVDYPGDSTLPARYTYQVHNDNNPVSAPLVATCDDPMYAGPMRHIAYDFKPGGDFGFLLNEKNINGTVVSSLAIDPLNANGRIETRGDGPHRTFTYSGGKLIGWTDFKEVGSSQTYDGNGFIQSSTDGNTHQTAFGRNSLTGRVESVTYPLTPSDTQQAIATRA